MNGDDPYGGESGGRSGYEPRRIREGTTKKAETLLLQKYLNRLNPDCDLSEDGVFGAGTQQAVLDFQKQHVNKLTVDGIVGHATWNLLKEEVGKSTEEKDPVQKEEQQPRIQNFPPFRRLRVFAKDPTLEMQLETVDINEMVLKVPWEVDRTLGEDVVKPGPVGEYLEIVDVDPASDRCYAPVDLNDPYLLAQDGLAPSEGNPQFHQQMVYAVAMTTIGHFEKALGRAALWAERQKDEQGNYIKQWSASYVQRLRIYPHALREANAYYSPEKKALLFGYFPASVTDPGLNMPGGMIFTCRAIRSFTSRWSMLWR